MMLAAAAGADEAVRPALAALERMKPDGAAPSAWVFPGGKSGRSLSSMALLMLLRRMDCGDLTSHGFRSTFRDWAAEATDYPREVVELAFAHAIGDKVEAAYRRGDLFEKRRSAALTRGQSSIRKNQ